MNIPLTHKSTTNQIQQRFDNDVERFSQLETGQQATIDAPLVLDLVAHTAATYLQPGNTLLDLGCGAGNFTLRLLQEVSPLECHLVDLSQPMLTRAQERLAAVGIPHATTYQADLRTLDFAENSFDCILAGAVLHHLREDADWETVFGLLHKWLRPQGHLFVADLVTFDDPAVQAMMWQRYEAYLTTVGGRDYAAKVVAYIDQEDSPRSLPFQLGLLQRHGFAGYDVLHRHSVFACYYGRK